MHKQNTGNVRDKYKVESSRQKIHSSRYMWKDTNLVKWITTNVIHTP
jgi:hypothetical protein